VWILDTDHYSLLQHQHPAIQQKIARHPLQTAIAIVTAEEALRGRFNVIRRADPNSDAFVQAYGNLSETLEQLHQINILRFTSAALDCYRDLIRQRIRIGPRDLRIASIALSINATVVTRNQKDFTQVPNLQLEDWTIC
jgi:tRNA(fMet)-specific endonuclease VapC